MIAIVPDANAHQGLLPCASVPSVPCNFTTGLASVGVSPKTAAILALYPLPTGPGNTLPQVDSEIGSENYLLGRVDYTLSDKDSLFFRYVRDFADTTLPFFGSPISPRWPEVGQTRNQFATIEHRRIINPTLVNLLRVSFTRSRETDVQGKPDQVAALDFFPERHQNGGVNITGLTNIGTSIYAPLLEVQNKFPIADDVIWTKGAHSVKIGGVFSRVQSNFQQQGWWGGFYTFPSLTAFLQGNPSLFQGPEPGLTDSYRDFREFEVDGYIHDEWKALPKLTVNIGLRYEFISNPHTVKHPINAIIHPPFGTYQSVSNVFASNPAVRNFDPRVGLAFDPFKDHKTSIRAGAGIFFNPIRARSYASGYYFNTPYALAFIPNPQFPNPFPGALPPPAQLVGIDYNTSQTPRMYQWNINIQRELFAATTLTVGYVGSRGVHLYGNRDINPIQPSIVNGATVFGVPRGGGLTGFTSNPRLNPAASSLSSAGTVADSNYNSLQVGLNRRFTKGLQAQASYTWSKCMDDASGTSGLEAGQPWTYPLNGSFDRGRCQFDRPQVFKLSGVYALPFRGNRLVSGWQLSGGLTEQSGPPWNPIIGFDQTGNTIANQRPNINAPAGSIYTGNINQWATPGAFALPAAGAFGNLQRNYLHGPGISNLDFSASKETRIMEQLRLQFRAEFFNLFNHADFGLPGGIGGSAAPNSAFLQAANGGGVPNSVFGKITTTTNNSRQIQLALKLIF